MYGRAEARPVLLRSWNGPHAARPGAPSRTSTVPTSVDDPMRDDGRYPHRTALPFVHALIATAPSAIPATPASAHGRHMDARALAPCRHVMAWCPLRLIHWAVQASATCAAQHLSRTAWHCQCQRQSASASATGTVPSGRGGFSVAATRRPASWRSQRGRELPPSKCAWAWPLMDSHRI